MSMVACGVFPGGVLVSEQVGPEGGRVALDELSAEFFVSTEPYRMGASCWSRQSKTDLASSWSEIL